MSNDPSERVRRRLNALHAEARPRTRADGNAVLTNRGKAWLLDAIEADLLSDDYRFDEIEAAAGRPNEVAFDARRDDVSAIVGEAAAGGREEGAFEAQRDDVGAILVEAIAAELISVDETPADTRSISGDGADKSQDDALLDLADGIRQAFLADAQGRRRPSEW